MFKEKYGQYYNRIVDYIRYVMTTFHDFVSEPELGLHPQAADALASYGPKSIGIYTSDYSDTIA